MTSARIILVTYTRRSENFTDDLYDLGAKLFAKYQHGFQVVVLGDTDGEPPQCPYPTSYIVHSGTKYSKLAHAIRNFDSSIFISVDNDIEPVQENIIALLEQFLTSGADIGWGKITAKPSTFVSKLVYIDKILSHDFIRPMLWKIGIGISIPGQVFIVDGAAYRDSLPGVDTYLDDLALGLVTSCRHMKRKTTKSVLGIESTGESFQALARQRIRWAKGYASLCCNYLHQPQQMIRILVHGFFYHALWLVFWAVLLLLSWHSPYMSLCLFVISTLLLAKLNCKLFVYSASYLVVFPFFHILWLISFAASAIRIFTRRI